MSETSDTDGTDETGGRVVDRRTILDIALGFTGILAGGSIIGTRTSIVADIIGGTAFLAGAFLLIMCLSNAILWVIRR